MQKSRSLRAMSRLFASMREAKKYSEVFRALRDAPSVAKEHGVAPNVTRVLEESIRRLWRSSDRAGARAICDEFLLALGEN